jgi:lipopolysaccharide transport system ATP-binding protein
MIRFQNGLEAPDGSIIGVIVESGAEPQSDAAVLGPLDAVPAAGNALLRFPFSQTGALQKARGISRLVELRKSGSTLVLVSHDEDLLTRCADEIWWMRDGQLVRRGDPSETIEAYRRHTAAALREAGTEEAAAISPTLRNGDGRAALESIELLGENDQPSTVWRSGEDAAIRVSVRYTADVADPVIGILIRTRIGLNVYGTNTELENIHPGPARAGDFLRVTYRFRCELCPGDYTVTAASHDPDGTWHDWQEDAVAFAVSDTRYTAGVANLRAKVHAEIATGGSF